MMRILLAAILATVPAAAAMARESINCVGQNQAYLAHVTEPLEDTTRSYAQGAVRILILSAPEPACCGTAVAVLMPDPLDGARICRLLITDDEQGWGGMTFGPGAASDDPASGLRVPMTATVWEGEGFHKEPVTVFVDQATGRVHIR